MSAELTQLAHLQEIETEAAQLSGQISGYAQKIAARQTALDGTARSLEENAKSLQSEAASRRRIELDVEDLRQKSTRYRAQLDAVQSDSQAQALEHQIAFCKSEVDRLEEIELRSLMQTETLEEERRQLDETAANYKAALENERATAQLGKDRDQARLAELHRERDEIRGLLEAGLLATYDRITAAKKFAVARVEGHQCSACQMVVRPQKWNEIREGAVHFCESCGRFLYYDPPVDLSDAIALPGAAKNRPQ
jgi:predicted  nucleic acid-binding Zn-ribbon protein